jgi:hypothetical protein
LETVAVYWEPRAKTYGFNEVRGLSLLKIALEPDKMAALGSGIYDLGELEIRLFLVLIQDGGTRGLDVSLLIEQGREPPILDLIAGVVGKDPEEAIQRSFPVGLIYFQGPHYGDRYGIADSAFRALVQRDIPILAAGCSLSSIYLVLPEDKMEEGRGALAKAFEPPRSE